MAPLRECILAYQTQKVSSALRSSYPEFYNYGIKPRFTNAKELILEACDEHLAANF